MLHFRCFKPIMPLNFGGSTAESESVKAKGSGSHPDSSSTHSQSPIHRQSHDSPSIPDSSSIAVKGEFIVNSSSMANSLSDLATPTFSVNNSSLDLDSSLKGTLQVEVTEFSRQRYPSSERYPSSKSD